MMTREQYLKFVADIGKELQPFFGSAWWYSLVHEKNTIKSRTYHNLVKGLKPGGDPFLPLRCLMSAVGTYLIFFFRCLHYKMKVQHACGIVQGEILIISYCGNIFKSLRGMKKANWIYIPTRNSKPKGPRCLYEFLEVMDFFLVCRNSLRIALVFLFRLVKIKSLLGRNYRFFREEFWRSFFGNVLVEGQFYERIFRNIDCSFPDVKKVIYPYEGLAWEKAMCFSLSRSGRKLIGLAHSTLPLNALNNFYHSSEVMEMPRPDFLGVPGRIPYELMEGSIDNGRLFISGTLRYQYLGDVKMGVFSSFGLPLVVLGSTDGQSRELLTFLRYCGKVSRSLRIKPHPDSCLRFRGRDMSLVCQKGSLMRDELMGRKAVITTESSAAIEAIAVGLPVICPYLNSFVSMNPLDGVSDLLVKTFSPEEFSACLDEPPWPSKDACKGFIRNYLEFKSDCEIVELLEKL